MSDTDTSTPIHKSTLGLILILVLSIPFWPLPIALAWIGIYKLVN